MIQCVHIMSQIAEIRISFDGGATSLNFAEAALLIQGSTCVYSRKVYTVHVYLLYCLYIIYMYMYMYIISNIPEPSACDVSVLYMYIHVRIYTCMCI